MKSNRLTKALGIAFTVLIVLFIAGLIGTPYLIDMGLERWIASRGPEIGQVENIDFNPFTGRLSMDNLVVETQSGRTLNITHAYLQFSWKQLFRKQLYLSELVLQESFMVVDRLDDTGFRVGGLILKELTGADKKSDTPGWEVGIGLFELQDGRIEYDTPELTATYYIDRYTLSGLETWDKDKPVDMELAGRINESPVRIKAEVKPLAAVKSWRGNIRLENGSLELVSKVHGLQEFAPKGTIDIDLELAAQMQKDGAIIFNAEGAVGLNMLQLRYEGYGLAQEKIAWQGHMSGSKTAGLELAVAAEGKLAGTGMALESSTNSLQLLLGAFNWQGKAGLSRQESSPVVTLESGFGGEDVSINDQQSNVELLGLNKFNVAGFEIAGLDDIRFSQVDLQFMRLNKKKNNAVQEAKEESPPLLQADSVSISDIRLRGGNDLAIGDIKLQDVETFIFRDTEGNWELVPVLPGSKQEAALQQSVIEDAKIVADEAGPIKLQLNNLEIGGKNSVHFDDESLRHPFRTIFHIKEFQVAGFDMAESGKPAQFKVVGQVEDYGMVSFNGTVKPSEKAITSDLEGKISALGMPPFSSYTGQTIGYNVTSGQLDADITMKIDKGIMDGIFDLRMRNLEVAQVDPEKMPEVDKQMDVPLGSALSMLRNKKDEINLELKLQGDITKPEFGIQDAINQALAKAMQFATLSYLKYTLQPFGTYIAIAEVVGKAGKEMSKVGLDPVLFPAGEIVLDETANQYLVKIKELLNNRPKLRIELCGRAVEKDRAALLEQRLAAQKKEAEKSGRKLDTAAAEIIIADEVLLDFARERAKLVKESLVKQHSINHERIYLCLPEIDETPDKTPYVELLLD